jgi:positive regulator of sigma E activity
MSGGELVVLMLTAIQAIVGITKLTVLALMKLLERYVGQPAAAIILTAAGVALTVLLVRALGRRLARWRRARRMRSLHGSA